MKKTIVVLIAFLSFSIGKAQNDLSTLIQDLLLLSDKFIQPAADGSVYQSASSWYKSGNTLNKWQFDVAVMNNVLFIPKKRRSFLFKNSEFQNLRLIDGSDEAAIPTAIGGDTNVVIEGQALGDTFDFRAFEGLGQDAVYHPYAQVGIGLPRGFEFKVRYSPKIEINGSNFEILGFGIQSNVNKLFSSQPKEEGFIQASALISYSKFKVDFLFDAFELPGATINSTLIDADSWLFQFVASKSVNKFDFFYAMGFTSSKFNYELGGESTLLLDSLNAALVELENTQMDLKLDLGFNYNFKRLTLNNTFSFGKFANYNLGIYYTIN